MHISTLWRRPDVVISTDIRGRLGEGGLLQKFEAQPSSLRRNLLNQIERAKSSDDRKARIEKLLVSLQREDQFETSRWKTGFSNRKPSTSA